MKRTIIARTSFIFAIVTDTLGYIAESGIQPVAKSKVNGAKAAFDSVNESLAVEVNHEERLMLLDTASEQLTAAISAMNAQGTQYVIQPFTSEQYLAVSQLIERINNYCKDNGIALTGINPFACVIRQLHLTLAKAGENKVMWQQFLLQAFEQLVVAFRNTVRTQNFAGAEYELTFPEFMIAPTAVEGSTKSQVWNQPSANKATSSRRELATAGAQA
ncbi:MAG: hypothetical protein AB7J40_01685 [Candidatus Altimarinota bacterium]